MWEIDLELGEVRVSGDGGLTCPEGTIQATASGNGKRWKELGSGERWHCMWCSGFTTFRNSVINCDLLFHSQIINDLELWRYLDINR